jgi:hypothetical protein
MVVNPDGRVVVLDSLPGAAYANAVAINNAGTVVGRSDARHFSSRPVVWKQGEAVRDLLAGTPYDHTDGTTFDINDAGTVTGEAGFEQFWWNEAEGLHLLSDLIAPDDPLAGRVHLLWSAEPHIDGAGRIVTTGYVDGVWHALLLTPQP